MTAVDDFRNIFAAGEWSSVHKSACYRQSRVAGPSGEIRLIAPSRGPQEVCYHHTAQKYTWNMLRIFSFTSAVVFDQEACEDHPWLVEPGPGRFLYVSVRGTLLHRIDAATGGVANSSAHPNEIVPDCRTRNRVALHAGTLRLLVCPQPPPSAAHHVVEASIQQIDPSTKNRSSVSIIDHKREPQK